MSGKIDKCVNCSNFILIENNPKNSKCKVKNNYVTKNALINAYCEQFE